TTIPSRRRTAVQQHTFRGGGGASADRASCHLDRQNLLATGYALGVSGAGFECGPLLPCRRGPFDCTPDLTETASLLRRNGRLLSGQTAFVGEVLRGRRAPEWTHPRRGSGSALALETTSRVRL